MSFDLSRDRYPDVVRALAGSPIQTSRRRVPSVRRGPLRPSERRCTCRARPRVPSGLHSEARDPNGQRALPPIGLAAAGTRSERMAQGVAEPVASQPRPPGTLDRTSHTRSAPSALSRSPASPRSGACATPRRKARTMISPRTDACTEMLPISLPHAEIPNPSSRCLLSGSMPTP